MARFTKNIKNFVNTCDEYLQFKITSKKSYGKIHSPSSLCGKTPWHNFKWCVDFTHEATKIVLEQKIYLSLSVMHALLGVNLTTEIENVLMCETQIVHNLVLQVPTCCNL